MSLEERAEFLKSKDGKPRDLQILEKLMTAEGRINFALYQVMKKPGAPHRYRALFDTDYRQRSNPGLERLTELDEEFGNVLEVYHSQALIYFFGPTEEINLIIAMKEDKMEIEASILEQLRGMHGNGNGDEPKEEWDLGLDDWMED